MSDLVSFSIRCRRQTSCNQRYTFCWSARTIRSGSKHIVKNYHGMMCQMSAEQAIIRAQFCPRHIFVDMATMRHLLIMVDWLLIAV
jgi:hypothetical protein